MSEKAEIANSDKSSRQDMQQKAAKEFLAGQRHAALLIVVSRIAPTKSDPAVGKGDKAMIGDSHAMGVAAEIV